MYHIYINVRVDSFGRVTWLIRMHDTHSWDMGWLRWVGSLKLQVSFAKEPYKRDNILQKRLTNLRSLLIAATPYGVIYTLHKLQMRNHVVCIMYRRAEMHHTYKHVWRDSFVCVTWCIRIRDTQFIHGGIHTFPVQDGVESLDALSSQVIFRRRALYLVALLRKMACNLRPPMSLRHPVVCIMYMK